MKLPSGLHGHPSLCSVARASFPAKIAGLALIACAALGSQAGATVMVNYGSPSSVEFVFDSPADAADLPISGLSAPPWFTATFVDSGVANTVTATFEIGALSNSEFLTTFFFNHSNDLTGSFSLPHLTVDPTSALSKTITGISDPNGAKKGFVFDMLIAAATSNSDPSRLTSGETVTFSVVYTPNSAATFEASDLFVRSQLPSDKTGDDPTGPYALAHLQGIGPAGKSLWVMPGDLPPNPVILIPEPGSTAALMGLLSCGLFLRSRRRQTA